MTLPKELFSWDEGPDEAPVPLGGEVTENAGEETVSLTAAVVEEAEVVVREAQDALARWDTDPAIPLSLLGAAKGSKDLPPLSQRGSLRPQGRRRRRSLRATAVVAACVAAFAHGWHQGSMAAEPEAASRSPAVPVLATSCEPGHCPADLND